MNKIIGFLNKVFAPRTTYYYNGKQVGNKTPEMKHMDEFFKKMDEAFEKFDEAIRSF
jgi:hypothetical protein